MTRVAAIALIAMSVVACAPTDDHYTRGAAQSVAETRFGRAADVTFFEVASTGLVRDTAVLWLATLGINTSSERGLVKLLRRSGPRTLKLLVSGPAPDKTYRILKNAFEAMEGRDLSHVHLVFVGPERQRTGLQRIAAEVGVRFTFVSFSEAAPPPEGRREPAPPGPEEGAEAPRRAEGDPTLERGAESRGGAEPAPAEVPGGSPPGAPGPPERTAEDEVAAEPAPPDETERVLCRLVVGDIGGGVMAPMEICAQVPAGGAAPEESPEVAPARADSTPLARLEGVAVLVEELSPQLREIGLRSDRIQRDVEFKLRDGGIRVYPGPSRFEGRPLLFVRVHPMKFEAGFGYSVGMLLFLRAALERRPERSGPAAIWERGSIGYSSPPSQYDVRDSVGAIADAFVQDFVAAQPQD
jgi:hypothetical protein